MTDYAELIRDAAALHGYDNCGIIPITEMEAYRARLHERMERVPESGGFYSNLDNDLLDKYPWGKSIVVCTRWIGKYRIPDSLEGHYGKHYLTDGRVDTQSEEWRDREKFEACLKELGIEFFRGSPGMRYAAMLAGIGVIRQNNFLYTRQGSYVSLDSWIIDKDAVLRQEADIEPCPETCGLCRNACKTRSLSAPYTMNPLRCVSFLTTFADALPEGTGEENLGDWVYGCDDCQDACPNNKNAWDGRLEFPGLAGLEPLLRPENLAVADNEALTQKVQPKLWYIPKAKAEKFRENARRVLRRRT